MQLTLKQARRLEKEIEAHVTDIFSEQSAEMCGSTQVSIHEDIVRVLDTKRDEVENCYEQLMKLIDVRYIIRDQIDQLKSTSGLNSIITREAMLKDLVKKFETFAAQKPLSVENQSVAVARLEALRHSPEAQTTNTYGRINDNITVESFLSEEQVERYKSLVRKLKKELAELADKSAALNTTQTFDLHDAHVKTLRDAKLID